MPVTLTSLTREFIRWPVTTDSDLTGAIAEVAFLSDSAAQPIEDDWQEAELLQTEGGWEVRTLIGPGHIDATELAPGDYQSWVRITDEPERPVRRPGVLTIE